LYKDGYISWCKLCHNEYSKAYNQKNKDKHNERNRKYYIRNKDKVLKSCAEYREKNKERLREYYRKYGEENKEKIRKESRERYKRKKEKWIRIITDYNLDICGFCGYGDCFAAIDFHHLDAGKKEFNVSTYMKKKASKENIRKFLDEVSKCVVLCSNCHRKLHYEE
jgi:hypothetical protein